MVLALRELCSRVWLAIEELAHPWVVTVIALIGRFAGRDDAA